MRDHERQQCPECLQAWPKANPRLKLAGLGWLSELPRHVSPSNIDCWIHDGGNGRNRFLVLETKRMDEQWPLQVGQARQLTAIAGIPSCTVRILRGDSLESLTMYRVTPTAIEANGVTTTAGAVHRAVASWLSGALWRDAEASLRVEHVHAWERQDATTFVCIRCGETWSDRVACTHDWQEEGFGTFRCSACGERYEPAA